MRKKYNKKEHMFIFITSFLAAILSGLYAWRGFIEGFSIGLYSVIILNILYITFTLIFKKDGFPIFYLVYTLIIIFVIASIKTRLSNNYSSLLGIFIVILYKPSIKRQAMILYTTALCLAFLLNEDTFYNFLIHITKSIWFYYVFDEIITDCYPHKKLILFDNEIKILEALSKKRLQKSLIFDGMSESTIYRRIKAACKRNHMSKAELIEEFKRQHDEIKNNSN